LKTLSSRLVLLGGLLLLLAAVRIAVGADRPTSAPAWEENDQEGVAQVLASATARLIPTLEPSRAVFSPVPLRTDTLPNFALPTQPGLPKSGSLAQAPENGETFLSAPVEERTVTADQPGVPVRIAIPAIDLNASVIPAKTRKILLQGDVFEQWVAPSSYAAGWITSSALLGEIGNTVLTGHHNDYGEVFGRLIDVKEGDTILVFSSDLVYSYVVTNAMILPELDVPVSQRIENARWIGRSNDERLTLVTCWPKDTNTHRLILVARPN
jgi:LPXTG-site transpeptidase (sortase) family protein